LNDFVIGTSEQIAHSTVNRNTQSVLMEKTGRRWKDNTKTEFKAIRWGGMDWIDLAQDRGKWLAAVRTIHNCARCVLDSVRWWACGQGVS